MADMCDARGRRNCLIRAAGITCRCRTLGIRQCALFGAATPGRDADLRDVLLAIWCLVVCGAALGVGAVRVGVTEVLPAPLGAAKCVFGSFHLRLGRGGT